MEEQHSGFVRFSEAHEVYVQPERLGQKKQARRLTIGIPKETAFQESRIVLVPDAVAVLTAHGHSILIESGAGSGSGYSDEAFSGAGANIVYSREEVYQSDVIIKVAPPGEDELELLKSRQVLISSLNWSVLNQDFFRKLMTRKITAVAFEYLRDKAGYYPVMRAMSEIAGSACMLIAAKYLADNQHGKGILLGGFSGISPTEVVVLGAGTVAEYAVRAALGMGAVVKVFDRSIYKLKWLQDKIQQRLYTSIIQPGALLEAMKRAHVVIGAVYSSDTRTPCYVSEDMVRQMQEGSVIIDVSIDHGGCFETSRMTTHLEPVYKVHGVLHYCVPNIPAMVPNTASLALSNIIGPLLQQIGEEGGLDNAIRTIKGFRQGVYMFNGIPTNRFLSANFSLPYQEIQLLLAAWD